MLRRLAFFLSLLLHPSLVHTYATMLLLNTGEHYPFLDAGQRWSIYALSFLLTFVLPISVTPLYLNLGWVRSIYMSTHRERVAPLLISSLPFFFLYFLFSRLHLSGLLPHFVLVSGGLVAATGGISYFWKISAHLTALGGWAALLLISTQLAGVEGGPFMAIMLLSAGLLASARLYLQAHRPSQVFVGFGFGFFFGFWGLLFSLMYL